MGPLRCRRTDVDPQLAGTLISPRVDVRGRGCPVGCPGLVANGESVRLIWDLPERWIMECDRLCAYRYVGRVCMSGT